MKSNSYNRWYTLLKWLFSLVSLGYFIYLIQSHDWYDTFIPLFISAWNKFAIYFILVFFMVFLNWNFEAQKFKLLLNSQRWSDRYLFFTVLGGMAISNFTPARSGEYIGRSLLLKKNQPPKNSYSYRDGEYSTSNHDLWARFNVFVYYFFVF